MSSRKKNGNLQLNISLATDRNAPDDQLVKGVELFEQADVATGPGEESALFFRQLPASLPKWTGFFLQESSLVEDLRNQGCGAILIVRRPAATFALTFGQAHHHLIDEAFEERFGLLVALNSTDSDRLRKVDTISLHSKGRQASVQVGSLGNFNEFGLNIDSDLVRKVAVAPSDASLGKQLVGRRALTLSVPVTAMTLGPLLDDLLTRYRSKAYKQSHQWLDNVFEVRNRATVARLDGLLAEAFRGEATAARLWAAVPDVVEWERIADFAYSPAESATGFPDIHIRTMRASFHRVGLSNVTHEQLKSRCVFARASADSGISYKWSFYKCLYCEVVSGGETYLLSNGSWFRVAANFVDEVAQELAVLVAPSIVQLPDYDDATEGAYNARVAALLDDFCCMDADNIRHGGGRSAIELCDLVAADGTLIFVKRYGGSKLLSHLFAQGTVTATLLAADSTFRDKVNAKLPASHRLREAAGRLQVREHPLVFAITTRKDQAILDSLPFFSKVSLRNSLRLLHGLGFATQVIPIRDVRPEADSEAPDE